MMTEERSGRMIGTVIEETEAQFLERIGAPEGRIEGTILVETGLRPLGPPAGVYAALSFRNWSPGCYEDDTAEVWVDYSGEIVYAVERDATGQRRWWFAGYGTAVEEDISTAARMLAAGS